MYKKWCKVIFRHKLSFFSMLLALALTIAIVTLLGQLISNLLISYKDVSADNSNFDWGFSSLTSEHVSKLEEAIVTNKVDVKGAVFENLLGTGRDEYGLDIELLSARGNIDLLMNARCTEGRMPQSIEEICITQTYIDKTGTLIQIGDEISFYIQEKNASETMVTATVVGILNRYSSYSSNYCFLTYMDIPGTDEAAQSYNCYFLYTDSDFEVATESSAKLTYLLVGATDFEALSSQGIGYISTNTLYAQQMSKEQSLYSIIPILTVMCIILIVVAVGFVRLLVGVMLTLRKKDYGILYALGLSRNGIKKILAFEAAVFFSCSIFPGGIISVALQNTAYSVLEKISVTGSISREGSWIALLLSLFVVLIGVAIAYGMLYNAISKKQPSEYLSQSSDDVNSTEKKQAKRITNGYLLSVESNISRNPMRSMGILIICFVTSLMLMIAIDMASFLSVDAMDIVREEVGELSSDYMLTGNSLSELFFSEEDIDKLTRMPQVERVYPFYSSIVYLNDTPSALCIYSDDQIKISNLPLQDEPLLYAQDLSDLIGSSSQLYSFAAEETVTMTVNNDDVKQDVRVSGLLSHIYFYDEAWPGYNQLICNEAFAQEYLANAPRVCSTILVETDLSYVGFLEEMGKDNIWLNGYGLQFREHGIRPVVNTIVGTLSLTGVLGFCLLAFLLIAILNISQQLCLLRIKEYSILQAIGYTKRDIRNIASIELSTLVLIATIFSVAFAYAIHKLLLRGMQVSMPWLLIVLYSIVLIAFTWISCQVVCHKILKKQMYERLCEVET